MKFKKTAIMKPKIIFTGTVPNININDLKKAFQKNSSLTASI